jgi:transposase
MDLVYVVRHRVLVEGTSARHVADELGISRNAVKRYVEGVEPWKHKRPERPRPIFEAVRRRGGDRSPEVAASHRKTLLLVPGMRVVLPARRGPKGLAAWPRVAPRS